MVACTCIDAFSPGKNPLRRVFFMHRALPGKRAHDRATVAKKEKTRIAGFLCRLGGGGCQVRSICV
jgi:hypothetical protein